jgi:restriction system protein
MAQYQRELERRDRATQRALLIAAREADRARRAYERARYLDEKERKRLYAEAREAEVDAMNERLVAENTALEAILRATLDVDDFLDFAALKKEPELPPFQPGALATAELAPEEGPFTLPPLSGMARLIPGGKAKHEQAVEEARNRYDAENAAHSRRERERRRQLAEARTAYESELARITARVEEQNGEVDEFRTRFDAEDPDAVVEYFSLVLEKSSYPEGFPKQHRMAFVPESKQLVVEFELPSTKVVPLVKQYRYVKARDSIESGARPATQVKALYATVVAETTLRTLHELFEADRAQKLDTIVVNGYVETIDPATGKPVSPHLVTVRTTRDDFLRLDLHNVEPLACLKGLNAAVSKNPSDLLPVRPILEFNMVDPRFVQESDVLGALDKRPNLMELTPGEFESLITNLFEKMGLETRQTQASRDGGVDCVAYDPRPIFGGKVVIQAKRYKHTVGVSAVRDLFGTMQNEGASKGILVTTSGYGKSSFTFAEGKPLELLSGTHLLYLLAEHASIEARIEPPEDWVDPTADIVSDEEPVQDPI